MGSLIIDYARKRDSGNYSCSPANSAPTLVTLHVINGKSIYLEGFDKFPKLIRNTLKEQYLQGISLYKFIHE